MAKFNTQEQIADVEITGIETTIKNAGVLEYTKLKRSWDQKVRYGVRPTEDSLKNGFLRSPNNEQNKIEFLGEDTFFIENELLKDHNIHNIRTISFDVAQNGWSITLFEAGFLLNDIPTGQKKILVRVVGKNPDFKFNKSESEAYNTELPGDAKDYVDIHFVETNADQSIAYALNQTTNQLIKLTIDHVSKKIEQENIALGANRTPMDFQLNHNRTHAYIVNQGDDSVSLIELRNENGIRSAANIEKEINQGDKQENLCNQGFGGYRNCRLKEFLPQEIRDSKTVKINPNNIVFQRGPNNDYLMISAEGLKGGIVIPFAGISTPADNLTPTVTPEQSEDPVENNPNIKTDDFIKSEPSPAIKPMLPAYDSTRIKTR